MAAAAILGAGGQLMLKFASEIINFSSIKQVIHSTVMNPYLYGFAVLYGVAVLINIVAYKLGGKVAVIYPVIALSYIFAALGAWLFFGEQLNIYIIIGSIIIILGVATIGYGTTVKL